MILDWAFIFPVKPVIEGLCGRVKHIHRRTRLSIVRLVQDDAANGLGGRLHALDKHTVQQGN